MKFQSQKQAGTYIFGEKLKAANWLLNHPFHIAAFGVLIDTPLIASGPLSLITSLKINLLFFGGIAFFLRFICRNLCYWVVIDTVSEKVTFYRCFNKGVVEAPLRSVEFVFDSHFACYYAKERFTIMNEYMGGISEVLPPGVEIRFSDGFYGRFMKKQFDRQLKEVRSAKSKKI